MTALRRPPRRLAPIATIGALAGFAALAALLAIAAWRLSRASGGTADTQPAAGMSVAAALGAADPRGFARALAPRPFVFPADHGPHPDFRTEWWYYTGNLADRDGRRFGFQLTFFRVALAPPAGLPAPPAPVAGGKAAGVAGTGPPGAAGRTSAWATRQVWFAHFAVTDAAGGRFLAHERWERQALGLAGARAAPFRVWAGNWSAADADPAAGEPAVGGAAVPGATVPGPAVPGAAVSGAAANQPPPAATESAAAAAAAFAGPAAVRRSSAGTPRMRLLATAGAAGGDQDATITGAAAGGGAAIDLTLTPVLPPVPQGDRGLSAKSAEPGNASYYYSLPRLAAAGTLRLGGETLAVAGLAWMDREWSTSALAAGEVGWDWFALQLDDGWELMLYRLRRGPPAPPGAGATRRAAVPAAADQIDPASLATWIAPDGHTQTFPLAALRFAEIDHWTSPASRTRYPSGWRLTQPGAGPAACDLIVRPLLADQELRLSFRYWEGAVAATGTHDGRPVAARGYVELTGYGDVREPTPDHRPPT